MLYMWVTVSELTGGQGLKKTRGKGGGRRGRGKKFNDYKKSNLPGFSHVKHTVIGMDQEGKGEKTK